MMNKQCWLGIFLALMGNICIAQNEGKTEKIDREYEVSQSNPFLEIRNVHGNIDVEGYAGDKIMVEVTKTIRSRSSEKLALGVEEIQLGERINGDSIYLFMDTPFAQFRERKGGFSGYHMHEHNLGYRYHLDFKVKVPKATVLRLSTVNDGDITVQDVEGLSLEAHNVNGEVHLRQVAQLSEVVTVNGDITAEVSQLPADNAFFKTINGDVEISYPENLSAELTCQTMNGDFFTDYQIVNSSTLVSKDAPRNGKGTKYRLEAKRKFQIGEGGNLVAIETLNGDIIVRKVN